MKIGLGADHAGFEMKGELAREIQNAGHEVLDLGAFEYNSLDDYPDFAHDVAKVVASHEVDRGVIICGSGIGASIAANKVRGVRAGVVYESYAAHQGVEHDDMNILVLGSRVIGIEVAKEALKAFLGASFSGEERHVRRLNKVLLIEESGL